MPRMTTKRQEPTAGTTASARMRPARGVSHWRILSLLLPFSILAWLVFDMHRKDPETWQTLVQQPKGWGWLGLALVLCLAGVSLSFLRWHLLVRALNIPFYVSDAFRLGFLGYLCNFVLLGSMGGDLAKAVMVARENPGRRPEVVASIFIDRVVGLLAVFLFVGIGFALLETEQFPTPMRMLGRMTQLAAVLGVLGSLGAMLLPSLAPLVQRLLSPIPRLQKWADRVLGTIELYRSRKWTLLAAGGISLCIQWIMATALFLAATGIYRDAPTLQEHLVIGPTAAVAAAIPVAPAGLGTSELAMKYLYETVPAIPAPRNQGLVVAVVYRMMTMIVSLIGVPYLLAWRKQEHAQVA